MSEVDAKIILKVYPETNQVFSEGYTRYPLKGKAMALDLAGRGIFKLEKSTILVCSGVSLYALQLRDTIDLKSANDATYVSYAPGSLVNLTDNAPMMTLPITPKLGNFRIPTANELSRYNRVPTV